MYFWLKFSSKLVKLRELLSQSKKIILGKPIIIVRWGDIYAPHQETVRGPLMLMLICLLLLYYILCACVYNILRSLELSSQAFYLQMSACSVEDYCEETIIIIVISPKLPVTNKFCLKAGKGPNNKWTTTLRRVVNKYINTGPIYYSITITAPGLGLDLMHVNC